MSTFIVRFVGVAGQFRGEARQVATGEKRRFVSAAELVRFLEEMNALRLPPADSAGGANAEGPGPGRAAGG